MRVITGSARGRKLVTVEGTEVVRPTTDRVKEAIFSAIQFEIEGRTVLDLFAGSGQLGIEALSRGASECWFADNSAASIKVIRENVESTGFSERSHIVNMPFSAFLRTAGTKFGIAILDPPYGHRIIQKALPLLVEKMDERGVIVCEHEKECVLPESVGEFHLVKILRHGRISLSIYRIPEESDENSPKDEEEEDV